MLLPLNLKIGFHELYKIQQLGRVKCMDFHGQMIIDFMDDLGFGHSGSVSSLKLNPSLYYDIQRYHYYNLRVESQLSLKPSLQ